MSKHRKLNQANLENLIFNIKYTREPVEYNIKLGDYDKIEKIKNKIDEVDQAQWTKVRKFSNKYESPFYITNRKVISRAYYKLWELLFDYRINCNTESLHLCEAPGGFIQATTEYKLKKWGEIKRCHTISLINTENSDTPRYHQLILSNTNVNIIKEYNGNLYNLDLIMHTCFLLRNTSISFITGDGGIAENGNFSNKEAQHFQLILSQLFLTCNVLEDFGSFILKIFDIYTDTTSQIIYLLCYLFDEVYIDKPLTSRPTNSEKYLICKCFIKERFTTNIKNELFKCLKKLSDNPDLKVYNLINTKFDTCYDKHIEQLNEYNSYFMSRQIYNIQKNLDILNDKTNYKYFTTKKNMFAKNWLIKYKLVH